MDQEIADHARLCLNRILTCNVSLGDELLDSQDFDPDDGTLRSMDDLCDPTTAEKMAKEDEAATRNLAGENNFIF